MPFIKKMGEDFIISDNQIKLTESYLKNNKNRFKKITGSRLAAVLDLNDYTSSVKTWCMMVGIYSEPMDPLLSEVGCVIEPKIKDYVENVTGIKYKQYVPSEVKFDVFKDDPIFGGIPDGEPLNSKHQIDYSQAPMLEIKTTSIDSFLYKKENNLFVLQKDENNHPIVKSVGTKREKWFNATGDVVVPNEYKFQLGLYCYLRHITNGLFAICFLKTDDYIDPKMCNVNEREVQLVQFNVNLDHFSYWVNQAKDWYHKYIDNGVSPQLKEDDWTWIKSELKI